MLENFSFNSRVLESDAHIDKIELRISGWELISDSSELALFRASLGNYRDFPHRPPSGAPLFHTAQPEQTTIPTRGKFRVRKPITQNYSPLVSGFLNVTPSNQITENTEGYIRTPLSLNCSLNPTRFLIYQDLPRLRTRQEGKRDLPNRTYRPFRNEPRITRHADEFSLDGKDNVALTLMPKSRLQYTRWQSIFSANICALMNYITSELECFLQAGSDIEFQLHEDFTIGKVEFYWEFVHEYPLSLMGLIGPLAAAAYSEARSSNYVTREETVRNSRSLSVSHRAGIDIKVYAKTNKRVRIEAAVNPRKNRELLRHPRNPNHGGSLRATSIGQLIGTLENLAAHATQSVNEFLSRLNARESLSPHLQQSSIAMVDHIYRAVGDDYRWARNLIECLVENGGYSALEATDQQKQALRRLVRTGVLSRPARNQRGWYRVHTSYTRARTSLRH